MPSRASTSPASTTTHSAARCINYAASPISGGRRWRSAGRARFLPSPISTSICTSGQDLTALLPGDSATPPRPRLSGDPVLLAAPTSLYVYFRSGDHLIEATAPIAAQPQWQATEIEEVVNNQPVKPIQDPRAAILGNRRHVVYVGDDQDWHLLILSDAGRRTFGGVLANAGLRAQRYAGMAASQPSIL